MNPEKPAEVGASLFLRKIYDHPDTDQVHIRLLSTPKVIKAIRRIQPKAPVLVKMDIEGSEFEVLRALLNTGTLCSVNEYNIEYHYKFMPSFNIGFSKFVKYLGDGCGIAIYPLDDETGTEFDLQHPEKATILDFPK